MKFRIQHRRYRLPFRVPVRTAHGAWIEREGLIVRLEDEHGVVGFGEAAPIPHFGTETVDEDEAGVRVLGEWTNEDAMASVPARLAGLRNAIAAARADATVPTRGTAGGGGARWRQRAGWGADAAKPDEDIGLHLSEKDHFGVAALLPAGRAALAPIAARAESGFRVFKWKVGVADLADELVLLDDVCAALPAGAKLRLDANGAWDRRQAERWLERCAERPVEFLEQPCFAEPTQGAARQRKTEELLLGLAGDFPTPIALDESLVGEGDIERWIGAGWPGVFVVKPSLLGDVRGALVRLEKAKAAVVFSSALETGVGAKAALRTAFQWKGELDSTGSPQVRALGFGVWPLFADARCDGPYPAPFLRREDVEALKPEAVWNALS